MTTSASARTTLSQCVAKALQSGAEADIDAAAEAAVKYADAAQRERHAARMRDNRRAALAEIERRKATSSQ